MLQKTLKQALYAHLSGLAGLTALVGTRIFPLKKPQGCDYPCVSYFIYADREWVMSGPSGQGCPTVIIDVWANTNDEADAVALAIRGSGQGPSSTCLDGFVGFMGGGSGTGIYVQYCRVTSQEDIDGSGRIDDLQPMDGSDVGVFRVRLECSVYYDEP